MSQQTLPDCQNFVEILRWRAQTHPELMAFGWFADGETLTASLSYAELDQQARAWGALLSGLYPAGTRALLVFPPGLDFMVAFAGCLYAGWVPVPAYPPEQHRIEHSLHRLLAIIADAQAPVVITIEAFRSMAETMLKQSGHSNLNALKWLTPQNLLDIDPNTWQEPLLKGNNLAFLQYTSGSTAVPKGVMISHGNLLANMAMIKTAFEHGERENTLVCWVPFYHDMGLVGHLLQSLYIGGKTLIMSPLDFLRKPLRWLQLISQWQATSTGAPNFAFDLCVRKISEAERNSLDLSSLRLVLNGAEPIQHATVERFLAYFGPAGFRRDAMYPAYGMAEATVFISGSKRANRPISLKISRSALAENRVEVLTSASEEAQTLISSGQAWGQEEIRIVDPSTCQPLPENQVGEIWLRGPHIAQGYWRQEALTQANFQAQLADGSHQNWLRSGDLGFIHQSELYVTGRIKDMIIIRGRNLYPQDIEQKIEALRPQFSAIRPGCGIAVALSGASTEELGLLLEVSLPFEQAEALCLALTESIEAGFEVAPRRIILLPPGSLPKTSSGKLMRQACRLALEKNLPGWQVHYSWPPIIHEEAADLNQTPQPSIEHLPPAKTSLAHATEIALEHWLRHWLATELQTSAKQINPALPLRSLGLDSALAVRLQADLENYLERKLSPSLLWDYPSLEKLIPALREQNTQSAKQTTQRQMAPIAILGMSCRFPGEANHPEKFWQNLVAGHDAISEAPAGRFQDSAAAVKGGYLQDIKGFDAAFFGISAREAENMDPQQRMLLELVWEALEQSGIDPVSLKEKSVGVFIGLSSSDYAQRSLYGGDSRRSGNSITGVAFSVAAGRIAYQLGTQGPTLTLDTACSSALVAIHLACQSLNNGECDLALVGAANLLLEPDLSLCFQTAGALSEDGHCKTFSAAANGYVRSEGGGAVVLKRASEHQPTREPLLATIRASAINHDGTSQGLTAPNGLAQQQLLRMVLERAGIAPEEVGFIETHGTGTPLGDPIEVEALHAIFGQRSQPLYLGAVKSQLGHLEAAAGMAGLLKTLLVLQKGVIPANLYGQPPNPRLAAFIGPLQMPQENVVWPNSGPRIAGVSSFGISGSNAHLILEQAPEAITSTQAKEPARHHLLVVSGRSQQGLAQNVAALSHSLQTNPCTFSALASHLSYLRPAQSHRLSWVAENTEEFLSYLAEPLPAHLEPSSSPPPGLVWVFSGQGGQWQGMGQELRKSEPVFAQAFAACSKAFQPWFPEGLEVLLENWQDHRIDQIQPLVCAMQISLAQLWRAWGIQPQVVIGHSMGEVAAAWTAGVLSIEQAAAVICERSLLMHSLPSGGAMLLTDLSWEEAQKWEKPYIARAVYASPTQTVLAGEEFALSQIGITLEVTGRLARPIAIKVASHSPLVDPLLPAIQEKLKDLAPASGDIPLISTVTGQRLPGTEMNAAYWAANLRQPVLFQTALEQVLEMGHRHFIEISPHPLLAVSLHSQNLWAIGSLRRQQPERKTLLFSLGELYSQGFQPNWQALIQRQKPINLPPAAWEHQDYWLDPLVQKKTIQSTPAAASWQAIKLPTTKAALDTVLLAGGSQDWRASLGLILESSGWHCLEIPQNLIESTELDAWQNYLKQTSLHGKRPVLLYLESLRQIDSEQQGMGKFLRVSPCFAHLPIWYLSQNQWSVLPDEESREAPTAFESLFYQCDLPSISTAIWSKLVQALRQSQYPVLALRQNQWWTYQVEPQSHPTNLTKHKPTASHSSSEPLAEIETHSENLLPRLRSEVAQLLRVPVGQIDPHQPLDNYGFDSLLAVELRQRIEKTTGLKAPTELLQRGVSIEKIQDWIKNQAV
jgi:acyl transferase domain-containing protein/acyl-CoA synthetase (AMP-forming)/AMP-acid ligase II/acyl carrier protein